jgi:hypothetical protein
MLFSPILYLIFFAYWGVNALLNINALYDEQTPMCGNARFEVMLVPLDLGMLLIYIAYVIYALY